MKVVHVSTLFEPHGGLEVVVQRMSTELAKMDHRVYVVASDAYAKNKPKVEKGLINIVRVGSWKNPYPYLIVPREIPLDTLREADIVVGWGHTYYFVYRTVSEAKKRARKTVGMNFIGVDYLKHHYNPLYRVFGYWYQRMLTRKLASLVDVAFVTNEREKELLKEIYGLGSFIVPHGVDEAYLKLPNMAKQFREKYGVDGRIVAYIGRIHPTKGIDILIKAFAKISRTEPDLQLLVAGKGDSKYLRKCLNLAKKLGVENRVRYLGYILEEDKIGLIDAAEAIVIPSRHAGESYPLIVDEVKAREKPLVVTNYGALPYRVKNMIEGVVVSATAEGLAKGVKHVLDNIRRFRPVEKPLTWSEVAKRLVKVYEDALKP